MNDPLSHPEDAMFSSWHRQRRIVLLLAIGTLLIFAELACRSRIHAMLADPPSRAVAITQQLEREQPAYVAEQTGSGY